NHAGGSAQTAVDKFGAIQGQAIGLQGQSYALPTISKKMQKLALSTIKKHLNDLNDFAFKNANLTFYVTKIGTGICGYEVKEIAELFYAIEWNNNIILPIEFSKSKQVIHGFKAYGIGMICNGFQFKEGEQYEHEGKLVCCPNKNELQRGAGGFHFCKNPLDVLDYYPLIDNDCNITEFSEVEGIGENKSNGNKTCVRKLKIGAKLSMKSFTKLSFKFLCESLKIDNGKNNNTRMAASGEDTRMAASGDYTRMAASGEDTRMVASGDNNRMATSGDGTRMVAKSKNTVLAAIGKGSIAKGILGTWITLAEYDSNDICLCVLSKQIDGVKLLPDTFYKLENGKFTKA
ncbi:MAG: hypothetical protein RSA92_04005, partial [Bacteroidaceae bacterium]